MVLQASNPSSATSAGRRCDYRRSDGSRSASSPSTPPSPRSTLRTPPTTPSAQPRPRRPARCFACRTARGGVSPDLVRGTAVVLSTLDGTHLHPERFFRRFTAQVLRARKALGGGGPVAGDPAARPPPHPRHSAAGDGLPVKVVSERLGHASATITLTVYQHVHPGMGREAADRFAVLLEG
jgi:integrase